VVVKAQIHAGAAAKERRKTGVLPTKPRSRQPILGMKLVIANRPGAHVKALHRRGSGHQARTYLGLLVTAPRLRHLHGRAAGGMEIEESQENPGAILRETFIRRGFAALSSPQIAFARLTGEVANSAIRSSVSLSRLH